MSFFVICLVIAVVIIALYLISWIFSKNNKTKSEIINKQPTKPVSSAIIENIKSDSANGKNKYFCLD